MGNYAGLTIEGADSFDRTGYHVADAGDFNGDGIGDVLVTSRYDSQLYVVFGQVDGPATFDLSDIDGTNGVRITAGDATNLPESGNFTTFTYGLGTFADGIGDINGDGIDDIVVGGRTAIYDYVSQYERPNGLFVLFGRDTSVDGDFAAEIQVGDIDIGTVDGFQIDGVTGIVNDVTSAGDINGDGIGDLLISQTPVPAFDYGGSPPIDLAFAVNAVASVDPDGAYAGYLIFGEDGLGDTGLVDVRDLDGTNGFGLATGRSDIQNGYYGEGGYYGYYGVYGITIGGIVALGDVNGDGFSDIGMQRSVATRTFYDPDGTPYSGDEYTQLIVENRAFVIFGTDGQAPNPAFEAGFDPANGGPNVQEIFWNTVSFNAQDFDTNENIVVAGIGDINGDGFDDVGVGNPNIVSFGSDNPTIEDATGRVSIYFGGPDGVDIDGDRDTDLNGESDGLNVNGTQAVGNANSADLIILKSDGVYDGFGTEIAGVGDVTGDGVDDFLITAARADRFFPGQEFALANFEGPNGSATGQPSVFLIFGQTAFDSTTPQVIDLDALDQAAVDQTGYRFISSVFAGFEGQQNQFGQSISAAGDVNGDGIGDFIIGSSGASGSSYQGGQSYVVFGGTAALEAADNADGFDDNVIDVANLDVDVDTGLLPIEVRIESAGFFSTFQAEGDAGATIFSFNVLRDGDLSETVSFDFDVTGFGSRPADGADFVGGALPSGNVTFGAGQSSVQVDIEVQGDFLIEDSEDFAVTISNATTDGASPISITGDQSFGRIFNDDNPVFFSVSNAFVIEGNPGDNQELTFTVFRFGETDFDASVDISFAPDTFRPADAADLEGGFPATQTVNFLAGETSQTVSLQIAEDVNIESDDRVRATLSNAQSAASPNGAQISDGTGIGTIQNDDFPPRILVEGGGFVTEGTGAGFTPLTFQILRQGDTNGATEVTFDLNPLPSPGDFFAAESSDIAGIIIRDEDGTETPVSGSGFLPLFGQTVRFEDTQSIKEIVVNVIQDGIIEPRESFELRITQVESFNGTSYDIFRPARTATILNDDGRPPVIPPGVEADVFGDPHIVTLDGLGYDFQATGEYILVETEGFGDPGDTTANPFQVQVRFEPLDGSDLVSTTTRMAVEVGGVLVEIDANAADPLSIGGSAPDAAALALGAIDVDGDGTPDVFFDAALSEFTIVLNAENEQLKIGRFDGALNVCVFLADTADGNAGNVRGLMGDGDGDGTADDLALRDGTVLTQPVDFDVLYGDYAESWNLDGSAADLTPLFSDGVTVVRDPDFPVAVLTVDDLPADLRAQAEAAVIAAGIDPDDEPAIFDAAVLDFALTGNPDFISGALGLAAEQTDETAPENDPDLPATVNVSAVAASITEGDAGSQDVFFTFSRFGDTEGEVTVSFAVGGDINGSDVSEGTDFTGDVTFADGETTRTISVEVLGDLATEEDEALTVSITGASGEDEGDTVLVAGASATTTILTDDFAPEAQDDEFSTDEDTRVAGNVLDNNLNGEDADADGDALTVTGVTQSNGVARAANGGLIILPSGAHLRINADGTFTYDPFGFSDNLGGFADSIFDQLDAGEVGVETFSYDISDGNGGTDTATVTISVQGINDAPVARIDEFNVDENSTVSGNVIDGTPIIGPDFDPEGGPLVVTQINGTDLAVIDEDATTAGTQVTVGLGGQLTIFDNGDFTFDTAGAYENLGEDFATFGQLLSVLQSVEYTIADQDGLTDSAFLRFQVAGVNDAPNAVDDTFTFQEDDVVNMFGILQANDSDAEGDDLSIVAANGLPTPLDRVEVTSVGGRTALLTVVAQPVTNSVPVTLDFVINPGIIDENNVLIRSFEDLGQGETDTITFTYDLSDGQDTSTATATVIIEGQNDGPIAVDDAAETNEDVAVGIDALGNDSDVDGDDLTIINVGTAANGDVEDIGDGFLLYTPDEGFAGTDTFTYTIEDGLGGQDTATVTVTVVADPNQAPVANDDDFTTDEDTPINGNLILGAGGATADNDPDGDPIEIVEIRDSNGNQLQLTNGNVLPEGGQLAIGADGAFFFDPTFGGAYDGLDGGESATATVTYVLSDGELTDEATVEILVNGVNDAPIIVEPTAFFMTENTIAAGQVQVFDVDDDLSEIGFAITGGADGALFDIDDGGNLVFIAAPDFEAPADQGGTPGDNTYQVEVTATDDGGLSSAAQLLSVTVLNDPDDDDPEPNVIDGTNGNDNLIGTDEDDIINSGGGPFDFMAGNGGGDIFVFQGTADADGREVAFITDYNASEGDQVDLAGRSVLFDFSAGNATYLFLDGSDFDTVIVQGAPSFADIDFV